jgi:hypothetical protein
VFAEGETLMKRVLLVLGPVLSIAGSSGLIAFGGAIVSVLGGVMNYRVVNPPEPLPASLGQLRWAAMSGMALACGLLISHVATVMRDSPNTISLLGKILRITAGVLLLIGAMPLIWGLLGAKSGFVAMATSAVAPTRENLRQIVQTAAPMLTVGCAVLLVGSVVLVAAGQVGVRTRLSHTTGTRSTFGFLAATVSVLLGVVASLLFVGVWLHGTALEAILADASFAPRPADLAQHLLGILNKSLLAFIGVGCLGILHAVAAIFAPTSGSEQTPNDSE